MWSLLVHLFGHAASFGGARCILVWIPFGYILGEKVNDVVYLAFLSTVYQELEDFDLTGKFYSFSVPPSAMDEE